MYQVDMVSPHPHELEKEKSFLDRNLNITLKQLCWRFLYQSVSHASCTTELQLLTLRFTMMQAAISDFSNDADHICLYLHKRGRLIANPGIFLC
jgi:hypothetical protein